MMDGGQKFSACLVVCRCCPQVGKGAVQARLTDGVWGSTSRRHERAECRPVTGGSSVRSDRFDAKGTRR
jgi:hypothetical protein